MKHIFGDNRALAILACTLIVIATLGGLIAIIVFLNTGFQLGVFAQHLCLMDECIKNLFDYFSATLMIISATGTILGGVVTFGGITIALFSYIGTAKASALSNHIAHMTIFSNYVYTEIDKRDRLNRASFDVLKLYNLIYKNSQVGSIYISPNYTSFIKALDDLILSSNGLVSKQNHGGYRYNKHQRDIIAHLSTAGILLNALPRLDFHEVEGQIFDLIDTINVSFCNSIDGLKLSNREYL